MALEIERRFLVQLGPAEPWRGHVTWQARLQQGYLSASPEGFTTRVRHDGDGGAWLTLKCAATASQGLVRHEFEYPIPPADAEALLQLSPQALSKSRYGLDLPGGDWVLDVFDAANAPLVIAEVELTSADQDLAVPAWCLREITGQGRFSNAALAACPLSRWDARERRQLLQALGGAAV
ncbi:MAG: CYTH domain-containing protein [Cyanobacteria bacterium M_surface_7_m2_040]|nr:CYTH domain-containing protein [Cyanobacteria bacterium M_surface_9_m1_291]MBM5827646.1 CYTH domain-containing protein [Cyanobacteria bacterium M_surface_7_m2_040]